MILTEISRHIPEILHIIFSLHKLPQVHTHCVQKNQIMVLKIICKFHFWQNFVFTNFIC